MTTTTAKYFVPKGEFIATGRLNRTIDTNIVV